jgi:polar amino acid transport system substrate-binding protein
VSSVRLLLLAAATALALGCAGPETAPSPEAREALAPGGKLRVAINLGNPVLAKRDPASGNVTGVTMDLGRMLATRVGAEFVPVLYPNPGALVEGARVGAWDIGFAAVDPARADVLEFTAPYMEVSVTYLVPSTSPVRAVADADRAGVRIGVGMRNAADLFLTRTLKQAQLMRIPDNVDAAVDLLRDGKADAFASNRAALIQIRDKLGGYRLLDERLYAVEHAIALPQGRGSALAQAKAFVEEAKRSGAVSQAIARHSIVGVDVAPPAQE